MRPLVLVLKGDYTTDPSPHPSALYNSVILLSVFRLIPNTETAPHLMSTCFASSRPSPDLSYAEMRKTAHHPVI